VNGGIGVLYVSVDDLDVIVAASRSHNLDFDDAYQYGLAEKDGLTLVSFDSDFDRTERGRKTPAEILH
jgi:predicted nucleic acid-binding protein